MILFGRSSTEWFRSTLNGQAVEPLARSWAVLSMARQLHLGFKAMAAMVSDPLNHVPTKAIKMPNSDKKEQFLGERKLVSYSRTSFDQKEVSVFSRTRSVTPTQDIH